MDNILLKIDTLESVETSSIGKRDNQSEKPLWTSFQSAVDASTPDECQHISDQHAVPLTAATTLGLKKQEPFGGHCLKGSLNLMNNRFSKYKRTSVLLNLFPSRKLQKRCMIQRQSAYSLPDPSSFSLEQRRPEP